MYAGREDTQVEDVVRVFRMLYAKVGNRADAEDLTTELFLAAFGRVGVDASRGEVRACMAAAARTALAHHWRARLGVEVTYIDAELAAAALEEPPASPAPTRVQAVLGALPERHRQVLELRFLKARSIRDVAREMGMSVIDVKVLQRRALCMAVAATCLRPRTDHRRLGGRDRYALILRGTMLPWHQYFGK